jgi:hypothetical protein
MLLATGGVAFAKFDMESRNSWVDLPIDLVRLGVSEKF